MSLHPLKTQLKKQIEAKQARVQSLEKELAQLRHELTDYEQILADAEAAEESARSSLEQAAAAIQHLHTVSPDQVDVFKRSLLALFDASGNPDLLPQELAGEGEPGEIGDDVQVLDAMGPV